MPGPTQFRPQEPRDLGDLETILRRLDSLTAFNEQKQKVQLPQPAPPHSPPVFSLDRLQIDWKTLVWVVGAIIMGFQAYYSFRSNSDAQLKQINDRLDRIDRRFEAQEDRFNENLNYVFTDYCRRTERKNPSWSCPDPVIMPYQAAERNRVRVPLGRE